MSGDTSEIYENQKERHWPNSCAPKSSIHCRVVKNEEPRASLSSIPIYLFRDLGRITSPLSALASISVNGDNISPYLMMLSWWLNELLFVKCLGQDLACSKYYESICK